jgi:signal transduction histidine kinase
MNELSAGRIAMNIAAKPEVYRDLPPDEEPTDAPASTLSVGAVLEAVTTHAFVFDRGQQLLSATRKARERASSGESHDTLADLLNSALTAAIPEHERRLCLQKASDILEAVEIARGQGAWYWANPKASDHGGLVYAILRPLYSPDGKISSLLFLCDELMEGALPDSLTRIPVADSVEEDRIELARQFAVTLNHEINNPLFVVSATLEDLLAEPLDESVSQRLQLALDSVWKVAEAVKLLQEIRQIVSKAYIPGYRMIDLEASSHRPK